MPDFDKTIEMSLTLNVDGAEKKAKTLREDIEKGKIELKTDLDISGLVNQIRIVESAIKRVSKSFKDETSNIGRSMRGLEFSSFEESILNIEDAVRGLDLQFRKMFKGDINLDVFKSLNNILKEINKNVGLISKKLQMNPIRTVDAVEAELDQVNQKIKQVKDNTGELEKLRKQLTSGSVKNMAKNLASGYDVESKEIDKLIAKIERYQKLGGDISSISFSVRREDLTTGKNINDTVTLISLLEDLSDLYEKVDKNGKQVRTNAQDIKLGEIVDASKSIQSIDELEKKVIELRSELERAKNADEPFGIRKNDIDTITKSFLNLQEVLEQIRNLLINSEFNIGKSFGDSMNVFNDLKSVVIEIKDLLKTFDIPKIKPDGDTAIRNWISDLEEAGEVAKSTDKAIEEAFKISNAQDAGSAVDLLHGALKEQADIPSGIQETAPAVDKLGDELQETGQQGETAGERIAEGMQEARAETEKTASSFEKVAEAVKKVCDEFIDSRRYSLGARDLSLEDATWDGNTYSPKKNRPNPGLVRNVNENDLLSNIKNQYSLYTKAQTAFKKGNINESELQNAANEFKNVVVSNFVAAFRRNDDKSLLYDIQNSLPKKILSVIDEYIQDAQTFIKEYNDFAENFRQLRDSGNLDSQNRLIELGKGINTRKNHISEDDLFGAAIPKFEDASDDLERYIRSMSDLSNYENVLRDVCNILGIEIPQAAERTSEAIREVNNQSDISTGIQEAVPAVDKLETELQETQEQAKLTVEELKRINTAFQKDTHTTNEDSLIPRETVSAAREMNNTLEQTEDVTKRIPDNVEQTALALRETSQQARSVADEIEKAFRADIEQKSKDNIIPTETLPAIREVNDALEQTDDVGTTALIRVETEAENVIDIFKRLADVLENIYRIGSTSGSVIDIDESQYRPVDTNESVRGLIEEKSEMDNVEKSASKAAQKKREFAEANQSVLASIKDSLKGLGDEAEAFDALNKLIKTMGKNNEMDNTIKGLEAIRKLLMAPMDDNSMISALKELAAQGESLKDLATVLKNATKAKLANAKDATTGSSSKDAAKAAQAKEQNKIYEKTISLLKEINKLEVANLSLSPNDQKYIANKNRINDLGGDVKGNLGKLVDPALVDQVRQKTDQLNDSLNETARELSEIQAKDLETLKANLNESGIDKFNDQIDKLVTSLRSVDDDVSFNNIKVEIHSVISEAQKAMAELKRNSKDIIKNTDIDKWSKKLKKEIIDSAKVMPKLKDEANEVYEALQKFKNSEIDLKTEKAQAELSKLKEKFEKVFDKRKVDEYKAASAETISKLNIKIDEFVKKNSAMGHDFQERFKNLKLEWDASTSIEQVKKLEVEFNKLKSEVYEADKTGASFFDTLRQRAMGVNAQLIGQYLSLQDMIRYTRQALSTILELDTALVDLKKTTTMSSQDLEEFYLNSNDVAKQTGVTTQEIISQAAAWSRLKILGLLYGNI